MVAVKRGQIKRPRSGYQSASLNKYAREDFCTKRGFVVLSQPAFSPKQSCKALFKHFRTLLVS